MISITKQSDYAIVILTYFSKKPGDLISAKEVSESLKLPQPIVSKLLKILLKSGLLSSTQGAHGGYRLQRLPTEISISSVIEAVEGPIAMTECITGNHSQCQSESWCSVKPHWALINQVIKDSLEKLPLSALNHPLPLNANKDTLYLLSKKAV